MRPQKILVVAAGVPKSIHREFVVKLHQKAKRIDVVACVPLSESGGYSKSYTEDVYRKFCKELEKRSRDEACDVLKGANVV